MLTHLSQAGRPRRSSKPALIPITANDGNAADTMQEQAEVSLFLTKDNSPYFSTDEKQNAKRNRLSCYCNILLQYTLQPILQ